MTELPLILRSPDVVRLTSLSRATIWRRIAADRFPKPIKLGGGHPQSASGWIREEILVWIEKQRGKRDHIQAM
jgi:predicted DNA-binding transcriptional regulator AlpA